LLVARNASESDDVGIRGGARGLRSGRCPSAVSGGATVNEMPDSLDAIGDTVEENAAAGTLVASLFSNDPDGGDIVSFSLADDAHESRRRVSVEGPVARKGSDALAPSPTCLAGSMARALLRDDRHLGRSSHHPQRLRAAGVQEGRTTGRRFT
jgi:hypothetical protein